MQAQMEGAPEREALEPEGRHMARFVGFPLEAEPGERIETAVFELCRHSWALWVCPGGMTEEHVEFVSVFLAYKGETSVQARFQFTLIDPVGVRTTVFADDATGCRFEGYDDHWGKHNCLCRSELSVICPHGEFAIEVGIIRDDLTTQASAGTQQADGTALVPYTRPFNFPGLRDRCKTEQFTSCTSVPNGGHSQYFSAQ